MRPELHLPAQGEGVRPLVLDTNIVLDLLVFADPAATPVRALLARGCLAWIATRPMRDELACVLAYPHVAARMDRTGLAASQVLAAFDAGARLVDEAPRAPCVCKDADDQKFIDLAAAHRAILLSKDQAVLRLRKRLALLDAHVAVALRLQEEKEPLPPGAASLSG